MNRIVLALVLAALATPAAAEVAQRRPGLNLPIDPLHLNDKLQGGATDNSKSIRQKLLQGLAKPLQDIADFIGQDAEDAITLSTAVPGIQDGHGQQCWIAARNFTAVFKAHPVPLTAAGMTDLQALRLQSIAARQLCEDTHCTQVFTDLKNTALIIAQGAAGQLGAQAVRNVPTLTDLCALVPNIPLAKPLDTVPPPPDVKPVGLGDTAAPPK